MKDKHMKFLFSGKFYLSGWHTVWVLWSEITSQVQIIKKDISDFSFFVKVFV